MTPSFAQPSRRLLALACGVTLVAVGVQNLLSSLGMSSHRPAAGIILFIAITVGIFAVGLSTEEAPGRAAFDVLLLPLGLFTLFFCGWWAQENDPVLLYPVIVIGLGAIGMAIRPHPEEKWMIDRLDRGIADAESALIVLTVTVMVVLAAGNLALHKIFDAGFEWADIVVRQMVLWLGFLGGALATYQGRHIAIDAAGRLPPPKAAAALRVITSLAAFVLSLYLLSAASTFIRSEFEDGSKVYADVPSWPFALVIPAGFAAISFHFAVSLYRYTEMAMGRREIHAEFAAELDGAHSDEAAAQEGTN